MSVAVLGCGPAGLLAAYGVRESGHEVVVYSMKRNKSILPGSLHLRSRVDGITPWYPDKTVTIVRMGSAEGYAQKVYGDSQRYTGWDNYDRTYPSWNAQSAYDKLWHLFSDCIVERAIVSEDLPMLMAEHSMTISTLPMPPLCTKEHTFDKTPYWIRDIPTPEEELGRELIVYNGLSGDYWYRYSVLGDKSALEYATFPSGERESDLAVGVKAIGNDCDCWPGLIRAGRWAEWKHGVLMHHAYEKAISVCQ
jgi:hypothetical protein